jgi:integrase
MIVRLYLIPGLGTKRPTSLTVPMVQGSLNERLAKGDSVRKVQIMRTVLSAALTRAVREELLVRNVARLVELPEWRRGTTRPWSADEALGLQWDDIDLDAGTIQVRRQLRRIRGELLLAPVKTQAGQRDLPLFDLARQALKLQASQQPAYRADMGSAWPETGLVFTTRTGRPIEPRSLVRSFRRICDTNKIRLIKVHHLRHTVGSLLKDLKVPVRDAQTILGHTQISITLEIYTLTDEPARTGMGIRSSPRSGTSWATAGSPGAARGLPSGPIKVSPLPPPEVLG